MDEVAYAVQRAKVKYILTNKINNKNTFFYIISKLSLFYIFMELLDASKLLESSKIWCL